ncbi:MAG: IMP cyclohydrolase [Fibrobacteraceae bacterium]
MMSYLSEAKNNFANLSANLYPGRGIVLGTSPCGKYFVQVYWIMGRSENSRNRIFVKDESTGFMRTQAFDESKVTDPRLIIYYPARHFDNAHIITNGDQTDTIYDAMKAGKTFEDALDTRRYEPDGPNFTPRISGITYRDADPSVYKLSILKTRGNSEDAGCYRFTYSYDKVMPGLGHFISTYATDGKPLPSFDGDPRWVPIEATAEDTLKAYWNALNANNRVSLMVKWIDRETFKADMFIKNKLG